jgi:hypothetical protein
MAETGGRSTDGPGEASTAEALACPVGLCPVGMFLTLAGEARPEVVEHLLKAGRELMLAARALLDARLQPATEGARLEKIDLE